MTDLFKEALDEGLARLDALPDEVLATEPVPEVKHATSIDGKRRLVLAEAVDQPGRWAVWTGGTRIGHVSANHPSSERWYGWDRHGNCQAHGDTAEEAAQVLDAWGLRRGVTR